MLPSTPPPTQRRSIRPLIREVVETLVGAVVLYFIISAVVGRFEIQPISLEPTLYEGQRGVISH